MNFIITEKSKNFTPSNSISFDCGFITIDKDRLTSPKEARLFWKGLVLYSLTDYLQDCSEDFSELRLDAKISDFNNSLKEPITIAYNNLEKFIPKGQEEVYYSTLIEIWRSWYWKSNINIFAEIYISSETINKYVNIVDMSKLKMYIY